MDLDAARGRLTALLESLDSSRGTFDHGANGADSGELSHIDQHPAEAASEFTEAERDVALLAVVEGQRTEVLEALRRVEEGTYGTCVNCGGQLPDERLEVRPEAARCVTCQQNLELDR